MTVQPFIAACVQLNAGEDVAENLRAIEAYVREAVAGGAKLVLLPECAALMAWGRKKIIERSYTEAEHPALPLFAALARELDIWIHGGTLFVLTDEGDDPKVANRTYVISPAGQIMATYDKIHMFDVDLAGGESYRESATFEPGTQAVIADLPWGRLGLSVCYDVRFPYLYRALAHGGADFLAVPAAFTRPTGEAHWHALLRARAIENGCYVFAPAQTGVHPNDRKTYGHALIIDPWGSVLADAGTDAGVIMAEIDPARVAEVRGNVPSLRHDRTFSGP